MQTNKMTPAVKLGYASASFGDSATYSFVNTFLLFFLTTVAGIEPAAAGTIIIVGSVWNTIINPIIGYLSDNCASIWGRRRPFLAVMAPALGASIFLLFTALDIIPAIKSLYYGAVLMIFWTAFTGFFVPHLALGAEYTQDYHERTDLRSYASILNMTGTLVGMVLPSLMADFFVERGLSLEAAWSCTGALVGITSTVSILITVRASKGRDLPCAREDRSVLPKLRMKELFGEYLEVIKLKPVIYLMLTSLFTLICNAMLSSDLMYYFTYNQKMDAKEISMMFLYKTVIAILLILVVKQVSRKTDKRTALMLDFIVGAAGITLMFFVGADTPVLLFVFMLFVTISTSIYWQLMPAIIYDVCEYDELETGHQRQGVIVSLQGLVEALAAGIGAQLLGIVLQLAGFDGNAAVQTETALKAVELSVTVLPAVFLVLAFVCMKKYPITKERFEEIQRKLAERKNK